MIKLIASDVDGTLLRAGEETLSDSIKYSLSTWVKNKNALVIASGRSFQSLSDIFSFLDKENVYFVCCDGTVTLHKGKVIHSNPLSFSDILKILHSDEYSYCTKILCTPFCSYIVGEDKHNVSLGGLHADNAKVVSGIYEIQEQIIKIVLYGGDTTPKKSVICPAMLRASYNSDGFCEYVSAIANKGTALSDIQMRLYLSKLDTAAFGDGENDIEMMKKARISVSVGNCSQKLKNISTNHTDNLDNFLDDFIIYVDKI